MGTYLNPGSAMLRRGRNSKIYVDKSELIAYLNGVINTEQEYVCVSRPRRFGKSMAANMVSAYYDRTVDGSREFDGLMISQDPTFDENRNRYDVIKLNMQDFLSSAFESGESLSGQRLVAEMISTINTEVTLEVRMAYSEVMLRNQGNLIKSLEDVFSQTGNQFVIIIDEWDCVMREMQHDTEAQKAYLDFLRMWLKDKPFASLCYMTGILPVKKYGKHSALNMFSEFSMTGADAIASSMGFTDDEVKTLCKEWNMSYDETRAWYDGYRLYGTTDSAHPQAVEIYSPKSIVEAMTRHVFDDYWNKTETYEALGVYLDMNFDGLRDTVIALLAEDRHMIDTSNFVNDMATFKSSDDVLTLLVHLGYLGYDQRTNEVFIPNREVAQEFVAATCNKDWDRLAAAIRNSEALLTSLIAGDEEAVAAGMSLAHQETSHLTYNSEEALAYTLSLGLYAARQWYDMYRELPAGKGFADLVLIPRRAFANRPAIVAELKWDQSAQTAITQIHQKCYPDVLASWKDDGGEVILAGISYDRDTREHSCLIQKA